MLGVITLVAVAASSRAEGLYVTGDAGIAITDAKATSIDTGARFSLGVGYDLCKAGEVTIAAELDSALIYNSIGVSSGGGDLWQLPLVVGLAATMPLCPQSDVSVGIGGGGAYVSGPGVDETDGAFQASIALRYKFSPRLEIGINYKYLDVYL
ncbi:MAG TPA: outer membrane beta-barrel protein, partial [Verrucomicrobiae bacterium]